MNEDLKRAFRDSDKYQAVYKLPDLAGGARLSLDRCKIIQKHIRPNARILDVGCAQGYVSLYFAERGAYVVGIDAVQKNIDFCQLLAKTLKINAKFERKFFSEATIQFAIANQINVVFLLSVLHHVITDKGLVWTQAAVTKLLDSGITLIAELAKKGETVKYGIWQDHVPNNEMVVFGKYASDAVKIGQSALLGNKVIRPIYLIRGLE